MQSSSPSIAISDAAPAVATPRVNPRQWALALVIPLVLYAISATPYAQWQDSGEFLQRVFDGQLLDPGGLCRVHPLHFWLCTILAKVLPFSVPMSCALVSALAGALTVANVFGIIIELTGNTRAACLAAAGLAVANSFWRFSCYIEVYTLSAAMLTIEIWALVKWDQTRRNFWLGIMFLANGLGLADHNLALLSLPVIGIVFLIAVFRRQANLATAFAGLFAWLAGAGMFLVMIVLEAHKSGWPLAIRSALVGTFGSQVEGARLDWRYTATSFAFTLFSFPNLLMPMALLGAWRANRVGVRSISRWAILAVLFMHLAFVLRYNVLDQYTFLMSAYALMAILAGVGFAVALRNWDSGVARMMVYGMVALVALSPVVYIATTEVMRQLHVLGRFGRNKPYRDNYRYLFIPWARGEHSAQLMSEHAAELAGSDGLVIELDGMGDKAIAYQLHLRKQWGVTVERWMNLPAISDRLAMNEPVVLVPQDTEAMPANPPGAIWRPVGNLFTLQRVPGDEPSLTQPADTRKAP